VCVCTCLLLHGHCPSPLLLTYSLALALALAAAAQLLLLLLVTASHLEIFEILGSRNCACYSSYKISVTLLLQSRRSKIMVKEEPDSNEANFFGRTVGQKYIRRCTYIVVCTHCR